MKKQQSSKIERCVNYCNKLIYQSIDSIYLSLKRYNKVVSKNPYARLMRLDKPIGFQLLVLPILWTLVVSSGSMLNFLYQCILFTFGAVIIRGAGTTINDIIDRNIDKEVARTKSRPLANGELKVIDVCKLLCILLPIAFLILITLPIKSIYFGIISLLLIVLYPFVKRYSYYPQIFLGLTFNMGVFIAWYSNKNYLSFIPILIYIAAATWTVIYDTIYAHQDKRDDIKIGVKSTAIKLNSDTKLILNYLNRIFGMILCIAGLIANLNLIFFLIILFALFISEQKLENLNLNSPNDCNKSFVHNFDYGILILAAFAIGKAY